MFSISVPLPGLDGATAKELKKLLKGMQDASAAGPVRGGVQSEGDAAAYALVWEWGNARQTQKGPKTTLGTNPDGEQVWLSIQAPYGYIRINEAEYIKIIENELGSMDFGGMGTGQEILDAIRESSGFAAQKIAEIIREHAPVDSGMLRESIQPCHPDDPDLETEDEELELGEGFEHRKLKKIK
jgi:hypothetical protein